jgi:hypothetical protein
MMKQTGDAMIATISAMAKIDLGKDYIHDVHVNVYNGRIILEKSISDLEGSIPELFGKISPKDARLLAAMLEDFATIAEISDK